MCIRRRLDSFRGKELHTNSFKLDYLADNMDCIGVAVLLLFVCRVEKSAECNNDSIFAMSERNVSLQWALRNVPIEVISAAIFHSSGNIIAELTALDCYVLDDSSTFCSIYLRGDEWILSLTIFNVTARQSGNYTLRLFQSLEEKDVSSKKLVVIEKPIIMEVRKPVLHQLFEMSCNTAHGLKCFIFRWKINGTEIANFGNVNAHYVSNLRITDDFSHVTCRICLNETESNFSSEILEHESCSIESDPYTIEVIYGPDKISLSLNESHFYLKDDESFTIDCFTKCNPKCTFWWKGHDIIESKKLVITSFQPRMAGQYTCYVTNQQTNITSESNHIILHHVKGSVVLLLSRENEGLRLAQYWLGPVIVSVFLLVVGLLILVTHWRKTLTRGIIVTDSRKLCQPSVGQKDSEVSREKRERLNRPLPVPAEQENVCRRTQRLMHHNVQRNSGSLENLSDQTKSFRNQMRENMPLRSLFRSPNTTERQTRNHVNTEDSVNTKRGSKHYNWLCCMRESANEKRPVKLFAKVKRDNNVANAYQNTAAKYEAQNNPLQEEFTPNRQEDLYSTINEDALSVYDYGMDDVIEKNSHEFGRSTEHVLYDYASSIEMCHLATADVHVTDETYLNPISGLARPFNICQDEEKDVLETDHTYLTLIDDLANPIQICQVEETGMNETDETYINLITG